MELPRNPTRPVQIGSVTIGGGHPIVVQSMCATQDADVEATVAQVNAPGGGRGRRSCGSRSTAAATPRPWPKSASGRRPISRSICRRTIAWRPQVAPLRRQDPLQPGPSVPSRAERALAGQGPVPGRRGRRARLRDPRGRELRLGRSGQAGQVSGGRRRSARCSHSAPGALRAAGLGWGSRATACR